MKQVLAPLAVVLMALSASAHAEWRHYVAVGHVTEALPMAPLNASVRVEFSFDDAQSPAVSIGATDGSAYGVANYVFASRVKLSVNRHTVVAEKLYADVTNLGGSDGASISLYGAPIVLDGTTFPVGSLGFTLASPAGKRVFKGTAIPHQFNIKRLSAPNSNYGWVQTDGTGNGGLLAFKLDSIKEVRGPGCDD
ncbi:hypothetical protein [Roseateles sp. BYS87W]|uniref:Polyisoprenoid-binding protein n=1 Tax=Pelomonas baiyunensis TaxID=3299026 RepID=A0ABW7GTA9_9BURK